VPFGAERRVVPGAVMAHGMIALNRPNLPGGLPIGTCSLHRRFLLLLKRIDGEICKFAYLFRLFVVLAC
jgi:hypothetical protein